MKIERMGSEHLPRKLIGGKLLALSRQSAALKYFLQVAVLLDERGILSLEISLRQFRLE
jgi:hypothetical protein